MLSGSFALASGAHGGWATSLAMDSCEAGSDARQRASVTRTSLCVGGAAPAGAKAQILPGTMLPSRRRQTHGDRSHAHSSTISGGVTAGVHCGWTEDSPTAFRAAIYLRVSRDDQTAENQRLVP